MMEILNSFASCDPRPQPVISEKNCLIKNTKTTRYKLSMIWVKESDGSRQRLIARWVTQD